MLEFIPAYLKSKITSVTNEIYEVRLRAGLPVVVTGKSSDNVEKFILNNELSAEQIEDCVYKLCNYSLFSVSETLKRGYVTSEYGERVGVCGEIVYDENGEVAGIKNFTSLCVRYPHAAVGCSDCFFEKYISRPSSILVFSPPFHGKTTFIRDLGRKFSDELSANVLYIDERDEFNLPGVNVGKKSDVLKYAGKDFGFSCGVRTLNPDVIIVDEIMTESDFSAVRRCVLSGVKVIASIHSDTIENIAKILKKYEVFNDFTFDFYVELKNFKVSGVFDNALKKI